MPSRSPAVFAAVLAVQVACLGPQIDDVLAPSGEILPAGSDVPWVGEGSEIGAQISKHDGVDGLIPRIAGFSGGSAIWYWDFGETSDFLAPIFVLVEAGSDAAEIEHPRIIGAVPGDPGYSPFWVVVHVEVTALYDGELLTSAAALEEAEELGLIEEPVIQPEAINCPVVAGDVLLEVAQGDPRPPDGYFFWRGQRVRSFDFGAQPITSTAVPEATTLLRLSRVGEPPLSEPVRGVSINGDDDINDTNDILGAPAVGPASSPVCRIVEVQVPSATTSIDDGGPVAFTATEQLFDPDPVAGNVEAFTDTGVIVNCPREAL